jgi:hypothetical protein
VNFELVGYSMNSKEQKTQTCLMIDELQQSEEVELTPYDAQTTRFVLPPPCQHIQNACICMKCQLQRASKAYCLPSHSNYHGLG